MAEPSPYVPAGTSAREIAADVERAVREGRLSSGGALPSVRALSARLGVSPGTVAAAYRELRWRGVVMARGRSGTRVRARPPLERPGSGRLALPPGVVDLLSGGPDPQLLPRPPAVRARSPGYGSPAVDARLAALARQSLEAEGVDPHHLAVVGGALDGVERVLGAWLAPGSTVAVEDPGYAAVLDLVAAMGLEIVPMPLDDRGVLPEALAGALRSGADAVVLTPRAQNPTGAAWDGPRARSLVAALGEHPDVLVIEDDHAGPIAGAPLVTVAGDRQRWATVRSVSKWLGPDLRLAVLAGDEATVARVAGRQALGTGWVSHALQQAVVTLWEDSRTTSLLHRATEAYRSRREALGAALGERGLVVTGHSGLTTWLAVADEAATVAALLSAGWAVAAGERFRVASPPGIRLAVGAFSPGEVGRLADDLAATLTESPARTG